MDWKGKQGIEGRRLGYKDPTTGFSGYCWTLKLLMPRRMLYALINTVMSYLLTPKGHVRTATSGARPESRPRCGAAKNECNSTESVLPVYDSSPSADETHRLSSNNPSTNLRQSIRTSSKMGKVHGSL